MSTEIKVNKAELQVCEKALANLATQVANRAISASIANSQGSLATELNVAIEQLTLIGNALNQLISRTENAVRNTWVQFEDTDTEIAHYFGIKEDT